MINPRKKQEILRSAMVASALISMVFGGIACNQSAFEGTPSTSSTDAKLAIDKIAEAAPWYAAREARARARVAGTALRLAHSADSGNYEAASNLALGAYDV